MDRKPTIDESILQTPVQGRYLPGTTFGEALRDEITLVFFLRHLG